MPPVWPGVCQEYSWTWWKVDSALVSGPNKPSRYTFIAACTRPQTKVAVSSISQTSSSIAWIRSTVIAFALPGAAIRKIGTRSLRARMVRMRSMAAELSLVEPSSAGSDQSIIMAWIAASETMLESRVGQVDRGDRVDVAIGEFVDAAARRRGHRRCRCRCWSGRPGRGISGVGRCALAWDDSSTCRRRGGLGLRQRRDLAVVARPLVTGGRFAARSSHGGCPRDVASCFSAPPSSPACQSLLWLDRRRQWPTCRHWHRRARSAPHGRSRGSACRTPRPPAGTSRSFRPSDRRVRPA